MFLEVTKQISESSSIVDLLNYFSIGAIIFIVGTLIKFYDYAKKQTIKEETFKNKITALNSEVDYANNEIQELKITDAAIKQEIKDLSNNMVKDKNEIIDKMQLMVERLNERLDKNIGELRTLLIENLKDSKK